MLKFTNAVASLTAAIYLPYIHSSSFLNKITFAVCPAENYISQLPLQKEVAMKRKEKCGATENALLSVFTAFCLKGGPGSTSDSIWKTDPKKESN